MIDLHAHSAVSDGTDTPEEFVQAALDARLDVVALTDHDTFDGIERAKAEALRCGVRVLAGIELSTQFDGASVHLLGYGCNGEDVRLAHELEKIRRSRLSRIPGMLERLADLGLPLTIEEVQVQAGGVSVGRPHVADALVARGYLANRTEAFERLLYDGGPAYVERYAPKLGRGIDLIREAGGVAVIAHPWGRGGRSILSPSVLRSLVFDHGLDGVEVDHNDHDARTSAELRKLAAAMGLLATGGSDYHGTGKTGHPLGCHTTSPEVLQALESLVHSRGGAL